MGTAISPGLQSIRNTPGMSAKIAKHLKITRQAVSDWDKVPYSRLLEVEQITGIDRERLRPELFLKKTRRPKKTARRRQ